VIASEMSEKDFKGTSSSVKAAALKRANEWWEKGGKVLKVISASQKGYGPLYLGCFCRNSF
jgi:hypothetical protein